MRKLIILPILLFGCSAPTIKKNIPYVVTDIDTSEIFDPVNQRYQTIYIVKIDDSIITNTSKYTYGIGDTINFIYYGY